jgi:hypothetical protein
MATNHLESMPLSDADGVDGGKLHDGAMEGVALTNEEVDDLFNDDQDTSQRPLDYETFLPGFSDDEGGETAFDRSWTSQKAGKASPKNKKSPRRSEDSDGDDLVAQTKRCCIKSRKRSNRTKIRVLSKHQDQTSAGDSPALPWTSKMRKTFTILRIYRKLKAVIASI